MGTTPINRNIQTHATAAVQGAVPASSGNALDRLYAANPKLKGYVANDPGLRTFLEKNTAAIVGFTAGNPPAGSAKTSVKLDTWTHATSIVPPKIRDEEYIVVVARGQNYNPGKKIEIPLQGGGMGSSDGAILYVGKTGDYIHTFVDDKDAHYPGAGSITFDVDVFGKTGEKVELTYCRIKPDAQGRAHPHHAAWPDSFDGVFGGYEGRDRSVTIQPGATVKVKNPD